jgi:hypothetical protein
LQESIAESDELVRGDPSNRGNLYIQVADQHLMGTYLVNLKRWPEAAVATAKAEALMSAALSKSPDDVPLLRVQLPIWVDQATTERNLGNLSAARAHCRQALALAATLLAREKNSKRPMGGSLSDVRREARLLGLRDVTKDVPGIHE